MSKERAATETVVVSVKMTRALRKRLRVEAAKNELKLQELLATIIKEYLDRRGA